MASSSTPPFTVETAPNTSTAEVVKPISPERSSSGDLDVLFSLSREVFVEPESKGEKDWYMKVAEMTDEQFVQLLDSDSRLFSPYFSVQGARLLCDKSNRNFEPVISAFADLSANSPVVAGFFRYRIETACTDGIDNIPVSDIPALVLSVRVLEGRGKVLLEQSETASLEALPEVEEFSQLSTAASDLYSRIVGREHRTPSHEDLRDVRDLVKILESMVGPLNHNLSILNREVQVDAVDRVLAELKSRLS
ncbi:MAG: hypothetical protein ACD_19C00069G0001 [uncultured bacterium]|nr:MAG: hypothetical protein ACD_19C00069G0001 [uncultured bacterium]